MTISTIDRATATLEALSVELQALVMDPRVWLAIGTGLAMGAACLVLGVWFGRRLGVLRMDSPPGEVMGVGLGLGLVTLSAAWAALFSGGRSAFTPVAVALVIAIIVTSQKRDARDPSMSAHADRRHWLAKPPTWVRDGSLNRALLLGAAFVVAVAVLYGVTMTPSPRGGLQPVEFFDEAYYSVLGSDLARTGIESMHSPSGFDELPGLPAQSWYHWGELWLAAAAISLVGIDPVMARHFVVLPLVLLAVACLTGTLVRRFTGSSAQSAFLFGTVAAVFLAPVPLPGPYFASWSRGLIFEITMYGLGAVSVVLALWLLLRFPGGHARWGQVIACAAVIAGTIPHHIVVAVLALVGALSVAAIYVGHAVISSRRIPVLPVGWRRLIGTTAAIAIITVTSGLATGHGLGITGLSDSVRPFNDSWRESLAMNTLGAGAYLGIPVAWFVYRNRRPAMSWLFVGTLALLAIGAVMWGARLGDFTMFHVFYGGITTFGTPAAAVAIWSLRDHLRGMGFRRLASALMLACAVQLEIGVAAGILRLQHFGPHDYKPIPVRLLSAIEQLPSDAKLAYACRPFEEAAFWNPRLVSITAHAGRPVVPMCFQAEFFGILTGTDVSAGVASPLFRAAPQRALYHSSNATPSSASIRRFLKEHGIEYIYVDPDHPNSLVEGSRPVAVVGEFRVLRIP